MTGQSVKTVAIWVIGLAIAVIGALQATTVLNGSKIGGTVLAVAGVLLPVIEHYITASTNQTTTTTTIPAGTTTAVVAGVPQKQVS